MAKEINSDNTTSLTHSQTDMAGIPLRTVLSGRSPTEAAYVSHSKSFCVLGLTPWAFSRYAAPILEAAARTLRPSKFLRAVGKRLCLLQIVFPTGHWPKPHVSGRVARPSVLWQRIREAARSS